MLVITVEFLPHGSIEDRQVVASAVIENDGTGTEQSGNYEVKFAAGDPKDAFFGRVEGFPRNLSVWWLIYRALKTGLAKD
jgi:hypothetical protein